MQQLLEWVSELTILLVAMLLESFRSFAQSVFG